MNKQTMPPELIIPKKLLFESLEQSQATLKLSNPFEQTFVFKIKTNNRTAITLNVSHGFLTGKSIKQIPIKMVENAHGVKLEIHYAYATKEMIDKKDSKLSNIDKQAIRKCKVDIVVENQQKIGNDVRDIILAAIEKVGSQQYEQSQNTQDVIVKEKQQSRQDLNIAPQIKHVSKLPHFVHVQSESLAVTEHPESEEQEEVEESIKKLKDQEQNLQKQAEQYQKNQQYSPQIVLLAIIISYIIGGIIRSILMDE